MQTIFRYCIVSDDVRLEIQNKASIIGLYGLTPNVNISVRFPDRPIPRMSFLLGSGASVAVGVYRTRLQFLDPHGTDLLKGLHDDIISTVQSPIGINAILNCVPLPLNGFGLYRVIAVVNGKSDYNSELTVSQNASADS